MNNGEFVTQWVLETVKETYPDDIALVVSHQTLRIDAEQQAVSYFIPITDKGRRFEQTFILNGEGFDIWGIEWERMEKFADLEEYNITCLADGEVLYARTPEDRQRFEALKNRQAEHLSNPVLMRAHALQAFEEAKQIYLKMLFAQGGDIRLGAGYVLDFLAQAVAFSNLRFFHKSQIEQLEELSGMEDVPDGFAESYRSIIREMDGEIQKEKCGRIIRTVEKFLERPESVSPNEHNFQDLADWYGELSYTWLRIRCYCGRKDAVKAFMWGIMLQESLNRVCADFGIPRMDLMKEYNPDDLERFCEHSNALEREIRKRITDGGGKIREYGSFEEFNGRGLKTR